MKTQRFLLALGLLAFYPLSLVSAQTAGTALPPGSTEQVGVTGGVRGGVELARGGQIGYVVSSGESVFLKDEVKTDMKGTLQILLLDQTAFTIGPNSALVINRFVYDPTTDAGKVDARIIKGTFRFITGKIARKKPEDMQIALPAGTIGIRGTMAMGSVTGENSLVVLTGPGKQNNTGNKHGELVISNEVGGETKSVNLTRTGFGTVIEGAGKAPSTPFQVPEAELKELTAALSPQEADADDPGLESAESSTATELAGQDVQETGEESAVAESSGDQSAAASDESSTASQDAADANAVADGITTIQQLLSIQSGQFHFEGSNFSLAPGGGSFSIHYDLDFGARRAGGGNSFISGSGNTNIDGSSSWSFSIPGVDFSQAQAGHAIFTYSGLTDASCATGSCTLALTVAALNEEGVIASHGLAAAHFTGSTAVDGAGVADRQSGLS